MTSQIQGMALKALPKTTYNYLLLTESNLSSINLEKFPTYSKYWPAGASSRCLLHWKQLIVKDDYFAKYDFGKKENL